MSHRIIIFQPVDLDFWNDETAQVHHADESWKCSILQTWIIDMKQNSMYPSYTMDIDVILNDIMTIQKTEVWHMHGWHWQLQFLDITALYWPRQHFLFPWIFTMTCTLSWTRDRFVFFWETQHWSFNTSVGTMGTTTTGHWCGGVMNLFTAYFQGAFAASFRKGIVLLS